MSNFEADKVHRSKPPELPPQDPDEDLRWKIERQFRDFEALFDCHICIHDVSGVFRMPHGEPWFLKSRIIHQAPICRQHHTHICVHHCSQVQNQEARQRGEAFVHHCWKGAAELVIPLIHEGSHHATFFAGAAKGNISISDDTFPKKIVTLQQTLPEWSDDKIATMKRVLSTFGNHLFYQLEQVQSVGSVDDRQAFIQRWLYSHAHERVGLNDLASAMSLSPSRCSHVVQEQFGQSFRYLLHHERLERARRLLLNSRGLAITEIANRAGFEDERHFSRSFKKKFGDAPGRYRRKYQVG